MFKRNLILGVFAFLSLGVNSPVFAVETPSFPVCANVSGEVKVSYSSGEHGIPGKYNVYSGSDVVYQLTSDTLMQCFCPQDASEGIQTNWWKISNLTETEIKSLTDQGWIYVPNGALWGLDADPYLAQNINYTCKEATTTSGGGGGGSSSQGGAAAPVVTTIGQVLGLATTGNTTAILGLTLAGISSLALGIILKKMSS